MNSNEFYRFISLIGFLFLFYFIYIIFFFISFQHLPPPFHNVPSDLFMDFYNTNSWSLSPGRYTEWGSIYPPLTFLIAKSILYFSEPITNNLFFYKTLAEKLAGAWTIIFFLPIYVLTSVMTVHIYKSDLINQNKFIKLGYYSFYLFSFPMLYLVERGNYLLLAYLIFLLILKKETKYLSLILQGFLINLKPYFVLFSIHYFIKKNYFKFIIILISAGFIFVISTFLLNDQNSLLFLQNTFLFSNTDNLPFQSINFQSNFDLILHKISNKLNNDFLIYTYKAFKIFVIIAFIYSLFIKRYSFPHFTFMVILILLILTYSVGAYLSVFLLPFIYYFRNDKIVVVSLALLMIPFDIIIYSRYLGFHQTAFALNYVDHYLTITLMSLIKPLLIKFIYLRLIFKKD